MSKWVTEKTEKWAAVRAVLCPSCGAEPGKSCRTDTGFTQGYYHSKGKKLASQKLKEEHEGYTYEEVVQEIERILALETEASN